MTIQGAGNISISTGSAVGGNGGDITMKVGDGDTGPGGDMSLTAGKTTAASAVGGAMSLTAGAGAGAGGDLGGDSFGFGGSGADTDDSELAPGELALLMAAANRAAINSPAAPGGSQGPGPHPLPRTKPCIGFAAGSRLHAPRSTRAAFFGRSCSSVAKCKWRGEIA